MANMDQFKRMASQHVFTDLGIKEHDLAQFDKQHLKRVEAWDPFANDLSDTTSCASLDSTDAASSTSDLRVRLIAV